MVIMKKSVVRWLKKEIVDGSHILYNPKTGEWDARYLWPGEILAPRGDWKDVTHQIFWEDENGTQRHFNRNSRLVDVEFCLEKAAEWAEWVSKITY